MTAHRAPPWLDEIQLDVLRMAAKVEAMLGAALTALATVDQRAAMATIATEREVDALELRIDQGCLTSLARRQPVASDLRFVTGVLKIVTHLERIGDLCESISRSVVVLGRDRRRIDSKLLERMGDIAREMLKDAVDAFSDRDAERALRVTRRDEALDACYVQCFPQLFADVSAEPQRIEALTRMLAIGKDLERVGDLATNIAEVVVFVARGERVGASGERRARNRRVES